MSELKKIDYGSLIVFVAFASVLQGVEGGLKTKLLECGWRGSAAGLFLLLFSYLPVSLWVFFDAKKWCKKSVLWIPAICILGIKGVYIYLACTICALLQRERV